MYDFVLIATPCEFELINKVPEDFKSAQVIVTGVGATNTIKAIKDLPRSSRIVNIGYVGSPDLPIGTMVKVGKSQMLHKVEYKEDVFCIGEGVPCYTSSDFVTSGSSLGCVYDMELAVICAFGFANITSYKFVSDNCNYSQYKQNTND